MYTLNCRGNLLKPDKPVIMGIINVTPDSFYEGHLEKDNADLVAMAKQMLDAGAAILDIGGQSTRPGSKRITPAEEEERVIPVIESIHKAFPETIISADTYYSSVAAAAVQAGASIVNDISAGTMDPGMIDTVAKLQVPYIIMHMQGTPETMQQNPQYGNVTMEVLDFFIERTGACTSAGIHDIIIDPGFGFGKTIEHNFTLLKNLAVLKILDRPILAGLSRKGTIYKTLGITAAEALNGTTCMNTIALLNGAHILRVHDVQEAAEAITLVNKYFQSPD